MKFFFKFKKNQQGDTMTTHIKMVNREGKYMKFAKHLPQLLELLEKYPMEIPAPVMYGLLSDKMRDMVQDEIEDWMSEPSNDEPEQTEQFHYDQIHFI